MCLPAAGQQMESVRPRRIFLISQATALEAVREAGKLVIGISADYAPFAFPVEEDDGAISYQGSDVELGKYIAEQLGVEAEFQEMEMEECLKAAKEGTVDLVLLGMLPEEKQACVCGFHGSLLSAGQAGISGKKRLRETNIKNWKISQALQWPPSTVHCRLSW